MSTSYREAELFQEPDNPTGTGVRCEMKLRHDVLHCIDPSCERTNMRDTHQADSDLSRSGTRRMGGDRMAIYRLVRPLADRGAIVGLIVLALVLGSVSCDGSGGSGTDREKASQGNPAEIAVQHETPAAISLATGDRGQLSLADHTGAARFTIELEVHDRRRLDAEHSTRSLRLVAVDGRRFDTLAEDHPEKADWVRFTVGADFLRVGLYMIEVDAIDDHALDMRRFVLDVVP